MSELVSRRVMDVEVVVVEAMGVVRIAIEVPGKVLVENGVHRRDRIAVISITVRIWLWPRACPPTRIAGVPLGHPVVNAPTDAGEIQVKAPPTPRPAAI